MKRSPTRRLVAGLTLVLVSACAQDAPEAEPDAMDAAADAAVADATLPEGIHCVQPGSGTREIEARMVGVPDTALVMEQDEFAADLEVELAAMTRCPSGIYIQDLVMGTGAVAQPGDTVVVGYKGRFTNGEVFDSTVPGQTHTFALRGLIIGWQEGIPGMREGGSRRLIVPYPFAYGAEGRGDAIPPRSDMIFDMELVSLGTPPADSAAAGTGN